MIKILLIESDPLFREALSESVNRREGLLMSAVSATDEALRMGGDIRPDIIIIDVANAGQAECLKEIDRIAGRFRSSKLMLLGREKRTFPLGFKTQLENRRIMAYTYNDRDLNGFIALLLSVYDNYTTYPHTTDQGEDK